MASVGPLATSAGRKKRARRLTNSERGKLYRSRRKTYVSALEEDVAQLKRQVAALQLRHGDQKVVALTRSPAELDGPLTRVVAEYFTQFQCGLPMLQTADDAALHGSKQAAFLQGVMAPDLEFGGVASSGVEPLLQQWARYSSYHAALFYEQRELVVMARDPTPVVYAPASLRVRFTRRTIEKVFPHVLWNEPLVQRLVGLELDYPVGNTFYFGADRRIHRYDTSVDFCAAFVAALGSIADAMQLLECAHISGNAMLVDGPDGSARVELLDEDDEDEDDSRDDDEEDDSREDEEDDDKVVAIAAARFDHTREAMSLRAIL